MGRFSQYLTDLLPKTGRVMTEDGGYVNTADYMSNDRRGIYTRPANGTNLDAFGRQRISSPTTLFDAQQEYGLDTRMIWDATANGNYAAESSNGSVSDAGALVGPRNINTRMTPITASEVDGSEAILQSRQYVRYIPGKSQFIAMTGIFATAGSAMSIVVRSSTSGSVVDRIAKQEEWSVDKFDGTGESGIVIDFTKTQILIIDAQWLSVGKVRIGFDIGGIFRVAHEFDNANQLTVPYTQTFNLPVRAEAKTDATGTNLLAGYYDSANGVFLKARTPSPGGTLQFICCTVQSEGGEEARGFQLSAATSLAGRAISGELPVIAIRPKSAHNGITNRSHVELVGYSIDVQLVDCLVAVVLGGTVTGGTWVSRGANSTVEYNITGTAISGGETIRGGFAVAGVGSQGGLLAEVVGDPRTPFILSQIDAYAARQIENAIVLTPLTGSGTARAAINWNEQTI
jgi:hypothetical protein